MAAGLSRHCDQEYEDAQTYYNAALDCIRRDPHVAEAEFRTRNERILGVLIECSADNLELEEAQARFDPRRIQGDL